MGERRLPVGEEVIAFLVGRVIGIFFHFLIWLSVESWGCCLSLKLCRSHVGVELLRNLQSFNLNT